jgi:hypothetical protein
MNAATIETALRDLVRVRRHGDGWLVDGTSMYASGRAVQLAIRGPETGLVVTDNGGAISELEAIGIEIKNPTRLLRPHARRYGVKAEAAEIFESRVPLSDLPSATRLVAVASQEAVLREVDAARFRPRKELRQRMHEVMQQRFSQYFRGATIPGKNKPHAFDYVSDRGDFVLIVDPVLRDSSSINSKVVAHLDVRAGMGARAQQLIVYDDEESWAADQLGILQLAAPIVPWNRMEQAVSRYIEH